MEGAGGEALQALRSGERTLERGQATAFQLTRKISGMGPEIVQRTAEEVARLWTGSDNAETSAIFSEILNRMVGQRVAECLQAIEHTREELTRAVGLAAKISEQPGPEDLPKPTGLPAFDASEITRKINLPRPTMLSFLGAGALVPYVRRRLEKQLDRALTEFLSLYANRLRKWMEQMLFTVRSAFAVAADTHRGQFQSREAASTDATATESDLRILQTWEQS